MVMVWPSRLGFRLPISLPRSDMLRSGAWGVVDQGLISGTNFITMALVARSLTPIEFGLFTLVYTILLLGGSIQSSLLLNPHSVLGAARHGEAYASFTTAMGTGQLALAGATAVVSLAGAALMMDVSPETAALLVSVAPAAAAWQLQEFVRRVMYTEGRLDAALANDVLSYGGQAVGIVLIWQLGFLTGPTALYVLAVTSALAALWGFWALRSRFRPRIELELFAETWKFAKWLFAGMAVYWLSGHVYPMLLAGIVSLADAGIVRAVQLVLGPTHILLNALTNAFQPRAARLFATEGSNALHQFVVRMLTFLVPVMGVYCLGVSLLSGTVLDLVFGEPYGQYGWVLVMLAVNYAIHSACIPLDIALRARRMSRPSLEANLCSVAFVFSFGIVGIYLFGLFGTMIGYIAHEVILFSVLWFRYRQADRRRPELVMGER
jgi:O-antigen/teichoic acid export membrane protein